MTVRLQHQTLPLFSAETPHFPIKIKSGVPATISDFTSKLIFAPLLKIMRKIVQERMLHIFVVCLNGMDLKCPNVRWSNIETAKQLVEQFFILFCDKDLKRNVHRAECLYFFTEHYYCHINNMAGETAKMSYGD